MIPVKGTSRSARPSRGAPFPRSRGNVASMSRRGDAAETMFEPVLNRIGYTVEHVFPVGQDPEMHGAQYIVVGMRQDGRHYATWVGVDWTRHPNPRDRGMGCVVQHGHYNMTEEEAFADALERLDDHRRYAWAPVPSGSVRSGNRIGRR